MSVDYYLAEILLAQQKIVADPQQVPVALPSEWDAGSHAGMDEIVVAAGKSYGQAVQKKAKLIRLGRIPGSLTGEWP
jgi:hypothetical protein